MFWKEHVPLSYSGMRLIFIQDFKQFVSDIKFYGLHCLRSGGATSTCNFGVPDRLFKRHGRWRSENAKDGYVKDSFNDLLFVSTNLGLVSSNYCYPIIIDVISYKGQKDNNSCKMQSHTTTCS
jgi:hypothetical protein